MKRVDKAHSINEAHGANKKYFHGLWKRNNESIQAAKIAVGDFIENQFGH